ncbi:MAG: AmmeMemoRadiSam system protein B [Deltaproteobacteria bacterium]|nr:AmmeMemoRadiSam system protein B [Deltaproteobacteria bacterium]
MDYPKLRSVEIFPVEMEERKLICFRDPQRIAEEMVLLPQETFFFVRLFDGSHSIRDIQAEYMRAFGDLIHSDFLVEIAENLDRYYLLENDRYRERRKQIEEDFLRSPTRKLIVAGNGYDSDPENLKAQMDNFFLAEGGPGSPPRVEGAPSGLKAVIAPHIDLSRGGPCYAWAYKEVAENSADELFILLGTSHMPAEKYFVLTKKDFATPFGTLPTDPVIVGDLEETLGTQFFTDELLHRNEHSLEFQAVYLHYLFHDRRNISILPVLCGSFYELMAQGLHPHEDEQITRFIDALRKAIAEDDRSICLVAGADLAHVGPQFGDSLPASPAVMDRVKEKDLEMLDHVVHGDAEGFYEYILRENDQRNICGLSPIYTLLRLLDDGKGNLLNYSQWTDQGGAGAVTFASIAFPS